MLRTRTSSFAFSICQIVLIFDLGVLTLAGHSKQLSGLDKIAGLHRANADVEFDLAHRDRSSHVPAAVFSRPANQLTTPIRSR